MNSLVIIKKEARSVINIFYRKGGQEIGQYFLTKTTIVIMLLYCNIRNTA